MKNRFAALRRVIVLLGLAALALVPVAQPGVSAQYRYSPTALSSAGVRAHSAAAPVNGHLFFHSDAASEFDIMSMDANGANPRITTYFPGRTTDLEPAVSPDGTKVVFQSNRGGYTDLYVMDADGSDVRQLTHDTTQDWGPMWSPDGTKIAWSSNFDGDDDIYVMNADGTGRQNVTQGFNSGEYEPTWSPDGTKIAFQSYDKGNWDIYYATLGDPAIRILAASKYDEQQPDWSPDGTHVAFVGSMAGNPQVWSFDLATSNATRLTGGEGLSVQPRWSPDSKQIAFSSNRDGDMEVFTMNADGSNQTQLTHNSSTDLIGDWQPLFDQSAPTVKASSVVLIKGKKGYLHFTGSDDSGAFAADVRLFVDGEDTGIYDQFPLAAGNGRTTKVPFYVPKSFKGTLRYCVQTVDGSANVSAASCAAIKYKSPPKPKPKHKPHS